MREQVTSVFWITMLLAILFILWGVLFPDHLGNVMDIALQFFMTNFGWFYQITATLFLLFALGLIFSRYGKIKLGKEEDRPEFKRSTWIAMLFSAGMGIGLMFFGVAEPISHFANPPLLEQGSTDDAAIMSLRYTYLHWGFHAWAIYASIALALAYFKFRRGAPGLISATLQPILGEKVNGWQGRAIDIIAVFATIFGVCASLGLGAAQINGGLHYLTGMPNHFWIQVLIIILVTIMFLMSASTGVKRGIRYLSNTNMVLAALLLITMIIIGPTIFLLDLFTTTFGSYLQNIPQMGLRLAPFNQQDAEWFQSWTIFYWAWWISWAPFVGTFIARVSKGRTVREFMIAVLIVPTLLCTFWFCIFGGTGIFFEYTMGLPVSEQTLETALFYVFQQLPLGTTLSIISLFLIAIFFITSADSATYVLGVQTTKTAHEPPTSVIYSWGAVLALSAIVLLASGGLEAIQTTIIVSAFPLTLVFLFMLVSILKAFQSERKPTAKKERRFRLRRRLKREQIRPNI